MVAIMGSDCLDEVLLQAHDRLGVEETMTGGDAVEELVLTHDSPAVEMSPGNGDRGGVTKVPASADG